MEASIGLFTGQESILGGAATLLAECRRAALSAKRLLTVWVKDCHLKGWVYTFDLII
jgi:hypothetical protein